jgi:20S proteasome subunit alpha 3
LIFRDLIVAVAGITSDANTLIDYARRIYQQYALSYGEPMPVEQLVQYVCNMKQSYTQHGGKNNDLKFTLLKYYIVKV